MTLADAIDTALRQNRQMKTLDIGLQSRMLEVDAASAAYRWRWSPNGLAETGADTTRFQYGLTASRSTVLGTEASVSGQMRHTEAAGDAGAGVAPRTSAIAARLDQPLLRRLGPLVNREPLTRAESQVAASRREVELRRTDLVLRVVEAYEDLRRLQQQVDLTGLSVERLRQFVALARARERQGRASRADMLRAEQKLGGAQIRLATHVEALSSRRADFAELIGSEPGAVWQALPSSRLELPEGSEEDAVRVALSNRLDYAQIQQDCDDASRGLRVARRTLLPDLKLISRYEQYETSGSKGDLPDSRTDAWFVGLALEGDFPRTSERISVEQAVFGVEASRIRFDDVRAAVARQVRQELGACERLKQQALLSGRNHAVARGRVKLARRQFESGKCDADALANAEDELREAEQQLLEAEAGVSVSAYRVLRVLGTLIEAPPDLKPRQDGVAQKGDA
jgi:outer membrane protein TolC